MKTEMKVKETTGITARVESLVDEIFSLQPENRGKGDGWRIGGRMCHLSPRGDGYDASATSTVKPGLLLVGRGPTLPEALSSLRDRLRHERETGEPYLGD